MTSDGVKEHPMKITEKAQYFNYLAIELLENLGNSKPTQLQIDLTESMISQIAAESGA